MYLLQVHVYYKYKEKDVEGTHQTEDSGCLLEGGEVGVVSKRTVAFSVIF